MLNCILRKNEVSAHIKIQNDRNRFIKPVLSITCERIKNQNIFILTFSY